MALSRIMASISLGLAQIQPCWSPLQELLERLLAESKGAPGEESALWRALIQETALEALYPLLRTLELLAHLPQRDRKVR